MLPVDTVLHLDGSTLSATVSVIADEGLPSSRTTSSPAAVIVLNPSVVGHMITAASGSYDAGDEVWCFESFPIGLTYV